MSATVWWSDYQTPVEQQTPGGATQPDHSLWVTNPTIGSTAPCIWDADDELNLFFGGVLAAGATYSYTTCLFGDWTGHVIGVKANASGVTASVSIDGLVTVAAPGCIIGPDHDRQDYPGFRPVTGSGGGIAVPHTITWTVTNPTGRKLGHAGAEGTVQGWTNYAVGYWCPGPLVRAGAWPGPSWYATGSYG
jgi:hypothetical protein